MKILFLILSFFYLNSSDFLGEPRLPENSFIEQDSILNDDLGDFFGKNYCEPISISILERSRISKPYCKFCEKTFTKYCYVLRHLVSRHVHEERFAQEFQACGGQLEKILSCDECSFNTLDKNYYTAHKARHSGHKIYQCDVCQMGFYLVNDLRRHKFTNHNDVLNLKVYDCPECKVSFVRKSKFLNHMSRHEKSEEALEAIGGGLAKKFKIDHEFGPWSSSLPVNSSSPCLENADVPKTELETSVLLINLKDLQNKEKKCKEQISHICQECGLISKNNANHQIHMARHQKKPLYFCNFCSWGCYLKNDLDRHVISKHNNHASEVHGHLCKECKIVFPRKNQLVNHEKKHQISLSCALSKAVGP